MRSGAGVRFDQQYDVAVVGAGILGLATALELIRRDPTRKVVVLDKEAGPGRHQTGHNSGVIHSGLYYAEGSAKARLCVAGRRLMLEYCAEHDIPVRLCGKLVVASDESELGRLATLHARGIANGLAGLEIVDEHGITEIEPAVRGIRAVWVPEAGIVSYSRVAAALTDDLTAARVDLRYGAEVMRVHLDAAGARLETTAGAVRASQVIACAGLQSDRIARMAGASPEPKIVPFRGDYYVLRPERRGLIRGLVYPVPDPRFPFLGVHFTPKIDGAVWLGPNAVFAFAREGYRRTDVSLSDLAESVGYLGFRRLVARHWRTGLAEMVRDVWKPTFLAALQRYVPALRGVDLLPGPSGVRAQALDPKGGLVDDFSYDFIGPLLNVRNAPSPAATSALALAREFADRLTEGRGGVGEGVARPTA
jgi:L-2-hydroxyglutarate oxidase